MASRFILPLADVGNGISPSDGAKLTFFITGTSTLKNTFSDEAATTPNTNPVVSDGDGLFPEIWIVGTYKVTLTDKNNKPKWEEDPVNEVLTSSASKEGALVAGMIADMSLNVGDFVDTVGYTTAGDGGDNSYEIVAAGTGTDDGGSFIDLSTHQAKGLFPGGVHNAKQWGVTGDNSTDDEPGINSTLALGGHVIIPDGDFILGAQLIIHPDTWLDMGKNCILRRAWAGTNGTRPDNATIKNENALLAAQISIDPGPAVITTWDENIHITGGQWGHKDDDPVTYRGTHLGLIGVRYGSFTGSQFNTQELEWCTVFWCEDFHIEDHQCNVATGGSSVSNDFIHLLGGGGYTGGNFRGSTDDDFVAIGSNQNVGIDGVTFTNLACDTNANAVKVLQIRSGVTSGFGDPTEEIKNINISGIAGKCGKVRTGYLDFLVGGASWVELLKDINISTVTLDNPNEVDTSNVIGIDMDGGVNINLTDLTLSGGIREPLKASNVAGLNVTNLTVNDEPFQAGRSGAIITDCTGVVLNNVRLKESGKASLDVTDSEVTIIGGKYPCGANGVGGILLQGTVDARISMPQTLTTHSATTDAGVLVASGATITKLLVNGIDAVNSTQGFLMKQEPSADVVINDVAANKVITISGGGGSTWTGTRDCKFASASAGNPDNLDDILDVPVGKELIFQPNDFASEPITVRHDGTRFIMQGAANYVMNSAASAVGMLCVSPGVYVEQWRV